MSSYDKLLKSYLLLFKQVTHASQLEFQVFQSMTPLNFAYSAAIDQHGKFSYTKKSSGSSPNMLTGEQSQVNDRIFVIAQNKPLTIWLRILANTGDSHKKMNRERRLSEVENLQKSATNIFTQLHFSSESDLTKFQNSLNTSESDDQLSSQLTQLLLFTADLLSYAHYTSAILEDPITQLPLRNELQHVLSELLVAKRSFALLLLNPDEFDAVNEQLGYSEGDRILRELAITLSDSVRDTDIVCRYGGAVFALVLTFDDISIAHPRVIRLHEQLTKKIWGGNGRRLNFSIGMTEFSGNDSQDVTLVLHQANLALNEAKISGGDCVEVWMPEKQFQQTISADRLSGIFTAKASKDYRNILLLWDMMSSITLAENFEELVHSSLNRISSTFFVNEVALFTRNQNQDWQLLLGLTRREQKLHQLSENWLDSLPSDYWQHLNTSEANGVSQLVQGPSTTVKDLEQLNHYYVPLINQNVCVGILYMGGDNTRLALDADDLLFLQRLGGQLATAIAHRQLEETLVKKQKLETEKLRKEISQLKQSTSTPRLLFQSSIMQQFLDQTRQIAQSDATVLIIGESGTGKEALAQTIHENSARKDKPLVFVDCATIPESLMERELFGHVKGAYTGAFEAAQGRVSEAEGGSLVLDEIGEIPLNVQSKLLRFVQEKQYSPVGSAKVLTVDVRIIAATNRNLSEEIEAGRFREDLYHRLNVITLTPPPLRERAGDKSFLAQSFLTQFAQQYQKTVTHFSEQALLAIESYDWPGNIRELKNTVMRAVILSQGRTLEVSDLQIPEAKLIPSSASSPPSSVRSIEKGPSHHVSPDIEQAIQTVLEWALRQTSPPAIGKWLIDDTIKLSFLICNESQRAAATYIDCSATTFRRHLHRITHRTSEQRPPDWPDWSNTLEQWLRLDKSTQNKLEYLRRNVTQQTWELSLNNKALSAKIIGVSAPTISQWLDKYLST